MLESLRGPVRETPSSLLEGVFFLNTKPFQTLDEQINILKSRGLVFADYDKAKRFLLTNNKNPPTFETARKK